ncbi:hypothetical protein GCM10022279_31140 [Comamonas faecalis]|uniref:MHYT domain-containing protein n=1 Tax=Comamonas faecalis TaxID=1387849 RepID=A0ABP7S0D3_9BURK
MYEIWLGLNIFYEIALTIWPALLALVLAWLALLLAARRRLSVRALRGALVPGALVALALFFTLPALTQSALSNMGYWVDWANLLAMALGFGAAAALLAWPALALWCPRCQQGACAARG